MIKKIALLFVAALGFLTSCSDIVYDAETRLVVEGRLVDKNGNAIPNQHIDIQTIERDEYETYGSKDIITNGSSDASGNFKFVIPGPSNEANTINVRINQHNGYSVNGIQEKQFVNIQRKNFVNYKFNLNTVTLHQVSDIITLTIITEQTNEHHVLSNIIVEGNMANPVVAVNPEEPMDFIPYEYSYELLRDQTVSLKYTVNDYTNSNNVVTTNYDVPIEINNQYVNYILNY